MNNTKSHYVTGDLGQICIGFEDRRVDTQCPIDKTQLVKSAASRGYACVACNAVYSTTDAHTLQKEAQLQRKRMEEEAASLRAQVGKLDKLISVAEKNGIQAKNPDTAYAPKGN